MRKIIHRHGPKFISHKNLLTLELSQYHKSDSTFSSTEPVAANSNYIRLGNIQVFVLASPTSKRCAKAPRVIESADKTVACLLE